MATDKLAIHSEDDKTPVPGEEPSHSEIVKQLERIVTSSYFKNSKRYPSFLRFVVEQTLAGNTDVLKERTLGIEVFARPNEYDTNVDPIVRVTAGEIRKRLAQYYQTPGHEHELRIDLPLGSYVPHFLSAGLVPPVHPHDAADEAASASATYPAAAEGGSAAPEHAARTEVREVLHPTGREVRTSRVRNRGLLLPSLVILLIVVLSLFTVRRLRAGQQEHGIQYFWQPTLLAANPVLMVIGVHSFDNNGDTVPTSGASENPRPNPDQNVLSTLQYSDMVPVSDIVSYSRLANLITRHSHVYQTMGSANATLDQLLHGPVVLIGGLDNIWTMRLSSTLRFQFFSAGQWKYGIRDTQHQSNTWVVDYLQPVVNNSRDYAVVASYFDPTIEQRVLIAAGIGKNGTVAASEFLTTDKYMSNWLTAAKTRHKNVELVLSTEILDGRPGPPHVLASYTW